MHPVAQVLPIHAPNAGRCLPAHAVPDRSQRQQSTRLVGIATSCSSLPQLLGTQTLFERNRNHAPPPRISSIMGDGITCSANEESTPSDSKRRRPSASAFLRAGISLSVVNLSGVVAVEPGHAMQRKVGN